MGNTVLNSLGNMLASASTNGLMVRSRYDRITATTTAATTSCGYQTAQRYPNPFTVPSIGGGLSGVVFPNIRMNNSSTTAGSMLCGLETLLGTVTANGGTGSFADGSAMPTKVVRGSSVTTATQEVYAVVTTVMVGAGSYTLTVTYKDQDGNTGATATLTIPNVAVVNSAFNITPHLTNGDYGIQDVTNITLTGTSGVIKIYGLLVLQTATAGIQATNSNATLPPMVMPHQMWVAAAGDIVSFYRISSTATNQMVAMLVGVADS